MHSFMFSYMSFQVIQYQKNPHDLKVVMIIKLLNNQALLAFLYSDELRQQEPLIQVLDLQISCLVNQIQKIPQSTFKMAKKQVKVAAKNSQQKEQKIIKPKKYAKTQEAKKRIDKSKHQRIFVLSAKRQQDHWDFTVQGTKLKNYNVMTGQTVKCTCMDFIMKKKPCKHIYFIVTHVAQNQQILDYFKNTTSISKNAYKVLDEQLSKRLRKRLEATNSKDKKDIDLKDDTDCVICFTQMNKEEQNLQDCSTCKKYFHQECITRWKQNSPTCPLCRSNLVGPSTDPLGKLQKIVV